MNIHRERQDWASVPQAPGMLTSHYAPSAMLRLNAEEVFPGEALLAFGRQLPPGADDEVFGRVWPHVLAHLEKFQPEFIMLQCGADSLEGDPITHLRFTPRAHGRAARELAGLADRLGHGRVLALGGGRTAFANSRTPPLVAE